MRRLFVSKGTRSHRPQSIAGTISSRAESMTTNTANTANKGKYFQRVDLAIRASGTGGVGSNLRTQSRRATGQAAKRAGQPGSNKPSRIFFKESLSQKR